MLVRTLFEEISAMSGVSSRCFMLLGQCVPTMKQNASKIRVKRLVLDKNLLMYFREDEFVYAHDPEKKCKTGDIVMVKELPQKLTTLITHEVSQIVYPFGDITDPITGKKVVVGRYRDQIAEQNKLLGKRETGFDYDKAPNRGWQEGIKDFTDRETYIKYHEYENDDQKYAV